MDIRDRYMGSLLGLAAGDALGAPIEFMQPGTYEPVTGMRGGGSWRLPPGHWTDDTSMALCLAESLVETGDFDPVDQLRRYVRWMRDGHLSSTGEMFDIGGTVRRALLRFEETGEPHCGSTDPYSAGNGCIMRLCPVPLFFFPDGSRAIHLSGESSRTTHGAAACVDACRLFAALIVGALEGRPKDEILSPRFTPVADLWAHEPLVPEVAAIGAGSYLEKDPPDIRGTGYVVESLEAALWAFHRSTSFEEGALLAVNLGDDADTTGAVYGQIAGAFHGARAIPGDWLDALVARDLIEEFATRLLPSAP